jgi:hypothetical protein
MEPTTSPRTAGRTARFGVTRRLGTACIGLLQIVLGIVVAIADGRPAAGHETPAVSGAISVVSGAETGSNARVSTGHHCPFCDFLAAQQTRLHGSVPILVPLPASHTSDVAVTAASTAVPPVLASESRAPPLG